MAHRPLFMLKIRVTSPNTSLGGKMKASQIIVKWQETREDGREAEVIVHNTVRYCGNLIGDQLTGDIPSGLRTIQGILGEPAAQRTYRELLLAARSPEKSGIVEIRV